MKTLNVEDTIVFYLDHKFKVNFFEINFPGKKSTPFSRLPKKSLDSKPLKISRVLNEPFDFIGNNLKPLGPVQPFGRPKSCILQGIISGQVTGNAGNIQNICSKYGVLIPPKKTIRFVPHQKPFVFYHIKHTYQSDTLISPFDFTILLIPTNRIYFTRGLYFFLIVLRFVDLWPVVKNENKPLTIDIIQTTSLNAVSGHTDNNHSLIYGSHIYKQIIKNKHREAMTINDYSSMFSIFKMHKKYAFSLKCKYVYVRNIVYVYVQNLYFGFNSLIRQRGSRGDLSPLDVHIHI